MGCESLISMPDTGRARSEDRVLKSDDSQLGQRGWQLVSPTCPCHSGLLLTMLDGVVFAPLGHMWLSTMQRIQLSSTLKSRPLRSQSQDSMLTDSYEREDGI